MAEQLEGAFKFTRQPCWDCQKAVKGCNWSRDFKPIEGWDATEVVRGLDDKGHIDIGYMIHSCPEFLRDGEKSG